MMIILHAAFLSCSSRRMDSPLSVRRSEGLFNDDCERTRVRAGKLPASVEGLRRTVAEFGDDASGLGNDTAPARPEDARRNDAGREAGERGTDPVSGATCDSDDSVDFSISSTALSWV